MSRNSVTGVAFLVSIALHLLLALWLARLMRPTAADGDEAMQVVLHDASPIEPALPTPPPPAEFVAAKARVSSVSRGSDSSANAMRERSATNNVRVAVVTPSLRLFNSNGSIRLPGSNPGPLERALARGRELMKRGHNVLHCRRGRFDSRPTPEIVAQEAAKQTAGFHRMFDDPNQMQVVREGIAAADVTASHDMAIVARERIDRACDDDQARGDDGATNDMGK